MRVKQNCKINLGLKVYNQRTDGFHDIESVFSLINIFDYLTFKKEKEQILVYCKGIEKQDNIVYKTALLFRNTYHINSGVKIKIKKNIPVGAGLGGGSADAAATIKALNKFWKVNLTEKEMIDFATKIGSDVPFFIRNKTAYVTGRGEKVHPLDTNILIDVLLYKPDFSFSTKEIYQEYTYDSNDKNNIKEVVDGIKENDIRKISFNIKNDLENSIIKNKDYKKYIDTTRNDFIENKALCFSVTGSGSAVFGIFESKNYLKQARFQLIKKGYNKNSLFICKVGNIK